GAVTDVPTLTAPMNIGRCMALRARAAKYVARGRTKRYSEVSVMTPTLFARSVHVPAHPARSTKKREHRAPAGSYQNAKPSLHRDRALHPHRKVRSAVILVFPGRHLTEGDRVSLVRIHHHRTRELRYLLLHVGRQLCLGFRRDLRRIEGDVVWAAVDHDAFHAVPRLYG